MTTSKKVKNGISADGAEETPPSFDFGELSIIKQLLESCTVNGKDALMIGLMINKCDDMIQLTENGTIKMMEGRISNEPPSPSVEIK